MSVIGGILLIIGAYFTYKGEIFKAVVVYLFVDLCWSILTYLNKDYIGLFFIIIGMLLGVLVYYKINKGIMHKTIKKDRNEI